MTDVQATWRDERPVVYRHNYQERGDEHMVVTRNAIYPKRKRQERTLTSADVEKYFHSSSDAYSIIRKQVIQGLAKTYSGRRNLRDVIDLATSDLLDKKPLCIPYGKLEEFLAELDALQEPLHLDEYRHVFLGVPDRVVWHNALYAEDTYNQRLANICKKLSNGRVYFCKIDGGRFGEPNFKAITRDV